MTLNQVERVSAAAVAREPVAGDVSFAFGTSSLGEVLVASTAKGICAILLGDDRAALENQLREAFSQAKATASVEMLAPVLALIENPKMAATLPLDLQGTDFEIEVWRVLTRLPAGRTMSYSDLAREVGVEGPSAAYEVSQACAANRIAVAVPCHRILRKDGSISGYRWGVRRKRALLKREGAL